ncbi:hypothetical protein M011DRAFT_466949 [Sporormia fimetaria CBS 119925]|uniref:Uncharacterized protein n=1 Tax=Sporormia fimetaria CBS 119925 TaxID=1340428 RepID=A0A6A6VD46_9PLEO|nr:hypothetical protein M011DRAFT_466949 [Sporormia fimetaria CBS 119925]
MPPHSKTVRGTLDNPKTKEAMSKNDTPPQPGDPVSLAREGSSNSSADQSANSSAPKETPGGFGIPADTYGLKDNAPSVSESFEAAKAKNNEQSHGDNYGLDRNDAEKGARMKGLEEYREVKKTVLGDPGIGKSKL